MDWFERFMDWLDANAPFPCCVCRKNFARKTLFTERTLTGMRVEVCPNCHKEIHGISKA